MRKIVNEGRHTHKWKYSRVVLVSCSTEARGRHSCLREDGTNTLCVCVCVSCVSVCPVLSFFTQLPFRSWTYSRHRQQANHPWDLRWDDPCFFSPFVLYFSLCLSQVIDRRTKRSSLTESSAGLKSKGQKQGVEIVVNSSWEISEGRNEQTKESMRKTI
jgi:hypothetical protein